MNLANVECSLKDVDDFALTNGRHLYVLASILGDDVGAPFGRRFRVDRHHAAAENAAGGDQLNPAEPAT